MALVYLTGHGTRMHSEEFCSPLIHTRSDEPSRNCELGIHYNYEAKFTLHDCALPSLITLDLGVDCGCFELARGVGQAPLGPHWCSIPPSPKQDGMDGDGTHSPFAKSLAFFIRNKALSLAEVLDKTSEAVRLETLGKQEPAVHARDVPLSNIYLGSPTA